MLSLLFTIFIFCIVGKIIGFAFRATWNIFKTLLFLALPVFLVAVIIGGLIHLALPILVVVGVIALVAKTA